jgi:hypothetical protein
MGYLTTGFVFVAEPSFAEIAAALPACSARGYRHGTRPVWLLDLWEKPWRGAHHPFQERLAAGAAAKAWRASTGTGADTPAFVAELEALLASLPDPSDPLVAAECRLVLSLSRLAGVPTFFFVGDDDLVDAACRADDGRLERFRCRLDRLTVVHEQGRSELEPTVSEEDDDDELDDTEDLVAAASRAVPWSLGPTRSFDGGRPLHESALALWPQAAGDPAETLGVGTWDPGENLERDFQIVFER